MRQAPRPGKKEVLPAFKTWAECVAYCQEKQDNFYATAFMLESWIGMIAATDSQIDRLVYSLYGLTDEEIALVEAAG